MSIGEILLIGVGLSMDAFAVSVGKGLCLKRVTLKNAGLVGLYFGAFQALMPLTGYILGATFAGAISSVDHWIAFFLLAVIGGKMIWEAWKKHDEPEEEMADFGVRTMLVLSVATSIDALAVGVSFSLLYVNIGMAAGLIGCTTLLLSMLGVKLGNAAGTRYKRGAEFVGGFILVGMGVKILLEHTL